ncbi:hypothetical protein BgiBS90_023969 [Biomphalaria glabrata]|nr:hypothetical protein BgiBS90_023969 [Biomphalaria glabrata]
MQEQVNSVKVQLGTIVTMLNEFNKLIYFRFEQMETTIKEQTSTMLHTLNELVNSLQGQSDSSDRGATTWLNNQHLPDQG